MPDVTRMPWAPWLERLVEQLMEMEPVRIGVCIVAKDVTVTGYYGEVWPEDKAAMAYHLHMDAVLDVMKANADQLLQQEDEEGGDTDG